MPAYAQGAIIATNVPITEKLKIANSIVESTQLGEGRVNEVCGIQNNLDSDLRAEIAALTHRLDKALDNTKRITVRVRKHQHVIENQTAVLMTCVGITEYSAKKLKDVDYYAS